MYICCLNLFNILLVREKKPNQSSVSFVFACHVNEICFSEKTLDCDPTTVFAVTITFHPALFYLTLIKINTYLIGYMKLSSLFKLLFNDCQINEKYLIYLYAGVIL